MTASELINGALKLIRVIGVGETPSATESADALVVVNNLIQSWTREEIAVQTRKRGTFTLQTGVKDYTFGPGGVFTTVARPVKVTGAFSFSGGFRQGMRVVSFAEYSQMSNPQGATVTLPDVLAADNATPLLNLAVHPPPSTGANIEIHWWEPLAVFASLATTVDFPDGYERALMRNLAVDLAAEYGRTVSPELAASATEAKASIASLNASINQPAQKAAA